MTGRRAVPQTIQLGEDEPHPVALLATRTQLSQSLCINRILRSDKAIEVSAHGHLLLNYLQEEIL